jgi:flagellar basal-body rod modification protein FlgD
MSTVSSATTEWWKVPTSTETLDTSATTTLNDYDSFLQLLAVELQNQDPSDPVSNTEYVAQMAQISTLQQLQSIYTNVSASNAYSMIGRKVIYETTDSSTGNTLYYSGVVESVAVQNNNVYLYINGNEVSLGSVVGVGGVATSETSET